MALRTLKLSILLCLVMTFASEPSEAFDFVDLQPNALHPSRTLEGLHYKRPPEEIAATFTDGLNKLSDQDATQALLALYRPIDVQAVYGGTVTVKVFERFPAVSLYLAMKSLITFIRSESRGPLVQSNAFTVLLDMWDAWGKDVEQKKRQKISTDLRLLLPILDRREQGALLTRVIEFDPTLFTPYESFLRFFIVQESVSFTERLRAVRCFSMRSKENKSLELFRQTSAQYEFMLHDLMSNPDRSNTLFPHSVELLKMLHIHRPENYWRISVKLIWHVLRNATPGNEQTSRGTTKGKESVFAFLREVENLIPKSTRHSLASHIIAETGAQEAEVKSVLAKTIDLGANNYFYGKEKWVLFIEGCLGVFRKKG